MTLRSDIEQDRIAQLSREEALGALRALAENPETAAHVWATVEAVLDRQAPQDMEDVTGIADGLLFELEGLDVEDVWDRAGRTRHGYVEPSEVANEMVEGAVEPLLKEMARYQRLGMPAQAMFVCMGLISGLYRFEQESENQFKEWAVDIPQDAAGGALETWRDGGATPEALPQMREFLHREMPKWAASLSRHVTPS